METPICDITTDFDITQLSPRPILGDSRSLVKDGWGWIHYWPVGDGRLSEWRNPGDIFHSDDQSFMRRVGVSECDLTLQIYCE